MPFSGQASLPSYVSNRNVANLATFTKKLQRVFVNAEPCYINMCGASETIGVGATYAKYGPPALLAARLAERGIPASSNKFGLYSTAAATNTLDPRLVFTGTVAGWTDLPGGKTMRITTNAGSVTYTPHFNGAFQWDVCDVYWYKNSVAGGSGGDFDITVDAGGTNFSTPTSGGSVATQTISTLGTLNQGVNKTTVTAASLGTHTISATRNDASNNVEIIGFEPRNSAIGTVLVRDFGFSGYTSTNYNAATINAGLLNANFASSLTTCSLGINDWANSIVLATYASNIATILANIASNGSPSILLMTPPPSATSVSTEAVQQTYVDALITAGSTTKVIADLWRRYVARGGQAALATTVGGYYNDTLHPNAWGNSDISQFLAETILWPQR
jgi:hypothetical protein